jgi:hypothetical protein
MCHVLLLQLLGLEVSRAEIADMLAEVDEDGSGEHSVTWSWTQGSIHASALTVRFPAVKLTSKPATVLECLRVR